MSVLPSRLVVVVVEVLLYVHRNRRLIRDGSPRRPPKGLESPGEIKRREVSWILTKKLAQKRLRAGRWWSARERELDFFCFSCFPTAELPTLSL